MEEQGKRTGYPSVDKPWLKYYSGKAIQAQLLQNTIYEYLLENNREYPEDIALLYFGRKITYGELFRRIDGVAAAFTALGVGPGEIVTVALPSIPEALYVVYALNKLGAVANMIHPLAGQKEIVHYLNEVESRVAVLFDGTYNIVKDAIGQTGVRRAVVVTAGQSLPLGIKQLYMLKQGKLKLSGAPFMAWAEFMRGGKGVSIPVVKKDPASLAVISHTGGTTGEPKGVMGSDLNANALMQQIVCNFKYDRQGVSLAVLPPFVNYSLLEAMMAALAIGYKVALIPKYEPLSFGRYVEKYRPNLILSIPAYWEAMLKIDRIERVDMSCFEQIYTGGENINKENEEAINRVLAACGSKTDLMKGLGSTEMMACATMTYADCNVAGSVGVPLVKVVSKIVDPDTQEELTYGQTGEICFTGPTLMMGYYNKPEETDAIVRRHVDGQRWLHTGDLGYMDQDGLLYITGRIKRIFMTRGRDGNVTKIFPDRIEEILSRHEAVAQCCAIGVPDEERIHKPMVFVVLKPGAWDEARVREEILALCGKELPAYMVPEAVACREDLPRTPRGKADYRALEAAAMSGENS